MRSIVFVGFVLISSLILSTDAQTCTTYTFPSNRLFSSCNDLPVLNSSLHWNYTPANRTVNLAYRHTGISSPANWVAWAINPNATGMVGSQALVAYQGTDGRMTAYTTPIAAYGTGLLPGNLSFPVPALSAEYANNAITIFATVVLPGTTSRVNQVWQQGPLIAGSPSIHDRTGDHLLSMGTVDFSSPQTTPTPSPTPSPTTPTPTSSPTPPTPTSSPTPPTPTSSETPPTGGANSRMDCISIYFLFYFLLQFILF